MQSSSLKRFTPWAVGLGFLGLAAAAVLALIYRQFNTSVQVSLVLGILGFILAILFNPGAVTTWFGGRQGRYGSNAFVMTLAFLGIVVVLNYLASRNTVRWDLSEGQINTLSPETLAALQQAPQPVKAIGFYSSNAFSQQKSTQQLLDRYKSAAPGKLTYEFHDPVGDPVLARQYNITRDGTLILQMGDQKEEISFASETEITSALVRFAAPVKRTLYLVTGHGEPDPKQTDQTGFSTVADLLGKQNYDVKPLNLQITTTVPADARGVVIAGPKTPLTAAEVAVLTQYMAQPNAALVVLLDSPAETAGAAAPPADPLVDYLQSAWGITARKDVVIDFNNSYPNQPAFPLNAGYEAGPITDRLQGVSTVFPVARSLEYTTTNPSLTFTPLIKTDGAAWGETDFTSLSGANGPSLGAGDFAGPLTLGVAVANASAKTRLVVFGDSTFASNFAANQGANANLFLNSINWTTLDETLINLSPKIPTQRTFKLLDAITVNVIFFVVIIAMPLLVLVLGGVVWFIRRRHV